MEVLLGFQEASGIVPKAILDRPKLMQHDRYYLECYYDLAAARRYNQAGIQPIPVADIVAYLDLCGIDQTAERYRMFQTVRRLDGAYLRHVMQKVKTESKENR